MSVHIRKLTKNDITYKATELFEGNESVALP